MGFLSGALGTVTNVGTCLDEWPLIVKETVRRPWTESGWEKQGPRGNSDGLKEAAQTGRPSDVNQKIAWIMSCLHRWGASRQVHLYMVNFAGTTLSFLRLVDKRDKVKKVKLGLAESVLVNGL